MNPHFDEAIGNLSDNKKFEEVLNVYMSRRQVMKGGLTLALGSFLGVSLVGCDDDDDAADTNTSNDEVGLGTLGFDSISTALLDSVIVAAGYTARVLTPYGTSLNPNTSDYQNDGANTDVEQLNQVGDHHDGMVYFPINGSSTNGILCINHENITRIFLHDNVLLPDDETKLPTPEQARKEIRAHGVTIVEIQKNANGIWEVVKDSQYNRRLTGDTVMEITGPVRGNSLVQTPFSSDGTQVRGTLNNCGSGPTPWNTYLTCEENWAGYFYSSQSRDERADYVNRYAVGNAWQGYFWHTLLGQGENGEFDRFDVSPNLGWQSEANAFGWMVEVNPYDPNFVPKKRTAMGRFAHEGEAYSIPVIGRPLAFYMGCDSRFEYIYKFVTANNYEPGVSNGDNMLNDGTLYVAKYNDDGTGNWLPLDINNPTLAGLFVDQGELLVKTRLAADAVGATPMDRPEWTAVHPVNGDIYVTLTNNTRRGDGNIQGSSPEEVQGVDISADAANPRNINRHGHIIRMHEDSDDPTATSFTWDIFLFGSPADADAETNQSQLTVANQFSSPDGMWIFENGLMVIETDDGSSLRAVTNNQLLMCIPNRVSEGDPVENAKNLKRFLVGPNGCEITGITMSPDYKSMFINIQHPGENTKQVDYSDLESAWPDGNLDNGDTNRPRSATVVITKNDGGVIGS